jgi:hypothetical protein
MLGIEGDIELMPVKALVNYESRTSPRNTHRMQAKAVAVYVTILAALAYRAYQYPVDLPVTPQAACSWRWPALRCSTGCTFRLPGGCKRVSLRPEPSTSASIDVSRADSLMRKRSVSSCLAAADIYEAAAAAAGPATAMMQLKAADAINCAMRIETNGNIMVLEGTVDTPAAKKFWAAHGPRSLSLIRAAKKDAALAADVRRPRWRSGPCA